MHGSKSEYGFRRSPFSFARPTEFLGTIREEPRENARLIDDNGDEVAKKKSSVASLHKSKSAPKKSATFHGLQDLKKCKVQNCSTHIVTTRVSPSFSSASSSSSSSSTTSRPSEYKRKLKRLSSPPPPLSPTSCSSNSCCSSSQLTTSRKRSIFYEMGERIRLFSTASFVSPATTSTATTRCGESTDGADGASAGWPGRATTMTVTTSGSGTVIGLAKSHSLNSFEDSNAPASFVSTTTTTTTRCQSGRKSHQQRNPSTVLASTPDEIRELEKKKARLDAIGSLLSLPDDHDDPMNDSALDDAMDLEKGLEKDVSQLGILCHHCSTTDLTCPKTQKELPSPSASSVYSLARSDMSNEPLCRICHCCWPPDSNDPLISPCRCSGSLQYVHVSCLMHWLDISSRKLHRPAICELCLYKYRRRRVLKYREMKLPQCAQADIRFYTLFVIAIVLMILSAFATVVCFQLEKSYGLQGELRNRTMSVVEGVASELHAAAPPPVPPSLTLAPSSPEEATSSTPSVVLGARKRIGDISASASSSSSSSSKDEYNRRDDAENVLSTVTLIAAMVFFLSFFLAMYAHVKSGLSFCGYLTLCWSSNLEWSIEEYKHSRDTQYLNKLEELRRKINEKQKKAADEVEPLRSSVIVLD